MLIINIVLVNHEQIIKKCQVVLGKEKAKSKIINNTLNPKAAQNRFSDVMYCICYLIGITPSGVKIDDLTIINQNT